MIFDAAFRFTDVDGTRTENVTLIAMELCELGELLSFMPNEDNTIAGLPKTGPERFSEPLVRTHIAQLLASLAYCHSQGIYHRDIKPANLLVDSGGSLRIADWGLCAVLLDETELVLMTQLGTVSGCKSRPGRGVRLRFRSEQQSPCPCCRSTTRPQS